MTHTDLSDEHSHTLIELYGQTPSALGDLPYTEEFERLYDQFLVRTGLKIERRYVWKALSNARKAGKLLRKSR